METGIAADAPLDYVSFQILPQNRYGACICSDKKEETAGDGPLEQLLGYLPSIKDQVIEGSSDTFKLELPDTVDQNAWFTKATLTRFLHIIGSPDSLNKSIAIHNEMSQLEEARKFHLSLYTQAEDGITSSDNSKNELLRALDSRLGALTEELVSTFNQAAGASISSHDMVDLQKFCQHFGDVNIRNLLSKLSETSQKGQTVPLDNKKSPVPFMSKNDYVNKMGENIQKSGSSITVNSVKYNASPAKAAELERQSSTESDDSSFSSEDDQPPVERSRPLIRSASPRRSASPMRRIQVGRSGPRRTPALTIKSLTHFPARDRTASHRESEESEEPNKKTEVNVSRISVQDAISLFESKKSDQTVDSEKRRSFIDNSTNANKSVLRRWSSGMGESQKSLSQGMSEHTGSEDHSDLVDKDGSESRKAKPDMDPVSGIPESEKTVEVCTESEIVEKTALDSDEEDFPESQAEKTSEKLDSAEWSRQREAELSQMLMKFAEFNVSNKIAEPDNRKSRSSRLEQKGVVADGHYKEKRDEKPKWESGKKVEKQGQFRAKQKVLDKSKAEKPSSIKVSDVGNTPSRTPHVNKTTPVSSNTKKESPKPAVPRKAVSKSAPLPATRKSWPSTPSPRTTGPLPAKILTGKPSGITAPRQKPQSPASLQKSVSPAPLQKSLSPAPRQKPQQSPSSSLPSPKLQRSELQPKEVKKPQIDTKKSLKRVDENKNRVVPKNGRTTKAKTAVAPEDDASTTPAKAVVRKKVTKKSSVVPLEAKPPTRKNPRTSPASKPTVKKTEVPTQVVETSSNSEDPVNIQENVGATISDTVCPVEGNSVLETQNAHVEVKKEMEIEKPKSGSEETVSDEAPAQGDEVAERIELPAEIELEQEPVISPAAWVESSHHDLSIPSGNSSAPSPPNYDVVASSEPRVRHSLSQMLLEESSEPDIIEWGNAENPPTMVYQKDAPKGLKRLLKFARKNKGEANGGTWASPYASDGEDDADEYKSLGKRSSENLLRKVALHSKNYGEGFLSDSEPLSARSNASNTSKGTRSFFSLSAFRGNKN